MNEGRKRWRWMWAVLVVTGLVAMGCGGDEAADEEEEEPWECDVEGGMSESEAPGYWMGLPATGEGDDGFHEVHSSMHDGEYLYVGTDGADGIYRRPLDDREGAWEVVHEYGRVIRSMVHDEETGLYAAALDRGLMAISEDGEEWEREELELAYEWLRIKNLMVHDGELYATIDSSNRDEEPGAQVVRRVDGEWERVGDVVFKGHPNTTGQINGLDVGSDGKFYVIMSNGHLYRSSDSGEWESLDYLVEPERHEDDDRPRGRALVADGEGRIIFFSGGIRLYDPSMDHHERLHSSSRIESLMAREGRVWANGTGGVYEVRDRELIQQGREGLPQICRYDHKRVDSPRAYTAEVWRDDDGLVVFGGTGETSRDRETPTAETNAYLMRFDRSKRGTSTDLEVYSASYLGSQGNDLVGGVDIAPDRTVVMGGRIEDEDHNLGQVPLWLDGGRYGVVVRKGRAGDVRSVTRIGDVVYDLAVHPESGAIAVATDRGVRLLNSDASQVKWGFEPLVNPTGGRVAIGSDGTVGYLRGQTLHILDEEGAELAVRTFGDRYVEDVAVSGEEGLVYITGFKNQGLPSGNPVQVAYVRAYDREMEMAWTNWDYHGHQLEGNEADTRGYRVSVGDDGMLYFAGESAGGNAIFRYDPQTEVIDDRVGGTDGRLVGYDPFTQAYQTAANHIGYFARLHPADGSIEGGQWIVPRLRNGDGNTFRPRAISADAEGNIYVGGVSAAHIQNRSANHIAGQRVGTYQGDLATLVVTPDMRTRLSWTPWNAEGGRSGSEFSDMVVRDGLVATAMTTAEGKMITHEAMQPEPHESQSEVDRDIYLSIWPSLH